LHAAQWPPQEPGRAASPCRHPATGTTDPRAGGVLAVPGWPSIRGRQARTLASRRTAPVLTTSTSKNRGYDPDFGFSTLAVPLITEITTVPPVLTRWRCRLVNTASAARSPPKARCTPAPAQSNSSAKSLPTGIDRESKNTRSLPNRAVSSRHADHRDLRVTLTVCGRSGGRAALRSCRVATDASGLSSNCLKRMAQQELLPARLRRRTAAPPDSM
jgi:hypothetical protein